MPSFNANNLQSSLLSPFHFSSQLVGGNNFYSRETYSAGRMLHFGSWVVLVASPKEKLSLFCLRASISRLTSRRR